MFARDVGVRTPFSTCRTPESEKNRRAMGSPGSGSHHSGVTTVAGRTTEGRGHRVAERGDRSASGGRFVRRVVTLVPGEERPYIEDEWRDTLILIARGLLELRCRAGGRRQFGRGDIL